MGAALLEAGFKGSRFRVQGLGPFRVQGFGFTGFLGLQGLGFAGFRVLRGFGVSWVVASGPALEA